MVDLKYDTSASLKFLERLYPEGPWVLTSIETDRKGITTATFGPESRDKAWAWVEGFNGRRNIYFSVNPPTRELAKKAEREDIREVAYLHVDIDPRAGEDIDSEQTRSLGLLTTALPRGVPAPTAVVFSGGGYQGFWKLEEPIPINGDLAAAEDAKRYNQQLELLFGADNCHNIDRIMRLPGTINVPDAKKRRKGRVEALAAVVEFHEDRVYGLSAFTPAPPVQVRGEGGFAGGGSPKTRVEVSGNVARLKDVDELDEWNVKDRVKVAIVQGHDPENPKKTDNSRSAWVFDVCCQLARAEVPDEVIFAVLTDPDFGISESILEKGSNAERYALRQIERAKEDAINPALRELNERHAVISNIGGKCRVVEEVLDRVLGRTRLTRQSFEDFRNRYMHRGVVVGTDDKGRAITVPMGAWWLKQESRRQFDTIVFSPGGEVPGSYNLWRGFAFSSLPGDRHEQYLQHIKDNICSGNEEYYRYLIGWMARAVQHPDSPGQVAVVMRGRMGTGKGAFWKHFGALWGRHYMQVTDPKHLVGSFNAHLRDCVVLFADEAFYAGDKKHESILKAIITEDQVVVEAKGVDAESSPNYLHVGMSSNQAWVIPAGMDERRYFVLDVNDTKRQDFAYFKRLQGAMDDGGYENLLHFLLTYDLDGFNVRDMPKTEALQEQKLYSLSPEEEWWYEKLVNGQLLDLHSDWQTEVVCEDLQNDFYERMRMVGVMRRASPTALGKFLQRVLPPAYPKSFQKFVNRQFDAGNGYTVEKQTRPRHYGFPTLDVARAHFEERFDLRLPAAMETPEAQLPLQSSRDDNPF